MWSAAAAAARRSVMIGGGGVSKMSAAAAAHSSINKLTKQPDDLRRKANDVIGKQLSTI